MLFLLFLIALLPGLEQIAGTANAQQPPSEIKQQATNTSSTTTQTTQLYLPFIQGDATTDGTINVSDDHPDTISQATAALEIAEASTETDATLDADRASKATPSTVSAALTTERSQPTDTGTTVTYSSLPRNRTLNYVNWQAGTPPVNYDFEDISQPETIPGWEAGDNTTLKGNDENHYLSTRDTVISAPFVLAEDVQQLSLRYTAEEGFSMYWASLLLGPDFTQETPAHLLNHSSDEWKSLKIGVGDYTGQTVKVKLRRHFGKPMAFDDVG